MFRKKKKPIKFSSKNVFKHLTIQLVNINIFIEYGILISFGKDKLSCYEFIFKIH